MFNSMKMFLMSVFMLFLVSGCITEQLPVPGTGGESDTEMPTLDDGPGEAETGGNDEETLGGDEEDKERARILHVVDVAASNHRGEHVAANTLDGDLGTRWSASGDGEWIRYDLGGTYTISSVSIAWYKGDQRSAEFELMVSGDEEHWTSIFGGVSSGASTDLERYHLTQVSARYVRIVGYGNTENGWNSITEVEIQGYGGASNHPPRISGVPNATATVGKIYQFQPTAMDPDGDELTFSIENKPAWAVFETDTGVLRGNPGAADVGTMDGIVISVTDGWAIDSLGPFSISVHGKTRNKPGLAPSPAARDRNGMIEEGFEDGDFTDSGFNGSGGPSVVSSDSHPVFEGTRSLQIFLDRKDRKASPSPYRREIKLVNNNAGIFKNLKYGKEYWIGFAIYLADDYRMPATSDILFQMHGVPDRHIGESYRNPNITLRIAGLTNKEDRKKQVHQWVIAVKGDHRELTPSGNKRYYPTRFAIPVGPAQPDVGRWVTWVFNFRNTYRPDGFIRVWKDGELVFERHGIRTAFNDAVGPYVNLGSYKPSWKRPGDSKNPNIDYWENPFAADEHPSRLSYLDAFRIAVGSDRYDDVAP